MSDNSVPANVNSVQNETNVNNSSTTVCAPKPGNEMSKVLLLDESSAHGIPKALTTLMSSLVDPTITDLTVVLLYIMTVETGFIPSCCELVQGDISRHYDIRRLNALTEMPSDWKDKDGNYTFTFYLQSFPNEKCQLMCSQILKSLSVKMFYCDKACVCVQTFSILINPNNFVDSQIGDHSHYIFKNLKELSVDFKKLPLAVRSCVIEKAGLDDGFLALPIEIFFKICDYLPAQSFLVLTSTCKALHEYSNANVVWKRLVSREFGKSSSDSHEVGVSWKEVFKTKLKEKRVANEFFSMVGHFTPQLYPPMRIA